MALHSPAESITSVRIPKLKVRNRPPGEDGPNRESLQSQSTNGTTATSTEYSDAITTTTLSLSPQISASQASPSSLNPPVRIPKLAVRNRGPKDDQTSKAFQFTSPPQSPGIDPDAITHVSSRPDQGPRTRSSGSNKASGAALTQRNLASRDSQSSTVNGAAKKKSKIGGLMNLLSLKEPSALALDQFAEAQRKQAQLKSGRSTAVGLPGVTDRKLPPEVPKVNSKWDGLPDWASEAAKEARKDRKQPDALLNKMADSRRATSSHGSVSTFESGHSRGLSNSAAKGQSNVMGRPASSSSKSVSSAKANRIRNPSKSRPRGDSSSAFVPRSRKASVPDLPPGTPNSAEMAALPEITSFFPTQPEPERKPPAHPSERSKSPIGGPIGIFTLTPESPAAAQKRPTLIHQRTISDPRVKIGMDNVAPLLPFLGSNTDLPTIASGALPSDTATSTVPETSTTAKPPFRKPSSISLPNRTAKPTTSDLDPPPSPPIPRRSSRRQCSSDSIPLAQNIIGSLAERSVPSTPAIEIDPPLKAATPPISLSPPIPAKSPSRSTTPVPVALVKAIFPPETKDAESTLASTTLEATFSCGSLPRALQQDTTAGPKAAPTPPGRSGAASPSSSTRSGAQSRNSMVFTHRRGPSGATSLAPSELSEQWYRSPQERLGLGVSPVKKGDVVPWETGPGPELEDSSLSRPVSRPASAGSPMKKEGKKGGRLSLFGKRPDSKGGNAMTGSPGIFASVVDKR